MNSLGDYKEISLPQGTLRYREAGDGPVLVFIHGLLVNGDLWRKVVPLLSDKFRCIAPDLPLGAHSLAMPTNADLSIKAVAKLIADFIVALGVDKVTLVGNDTGGALCQVVITEHPAQVERLILTNCDAYENFPPPLLRPFVWGSYLPGFVYGLSRLFPIRAFHHTPLILALVCKHPVEKQAVDSYITPTRHSEGVRHDLTKFLQGISSKVTLEAAQYFKNFTKPVLIVWAVEDKLFGISYAYRLKEAFPNATLEVITDSYAFISEDQPAKLAPLIEKFMTKEQP